MSQASLIKRKDPDLTLILESSEQVERLLKKVQLSGDLDYIGTIALHLHSFYHGAMLDLPQVAHPSANRLVTPTDNPIHGWATLGKVFVGVEHIFLGVAKSIDNSVPAGEDWHRQLLIQMTLPLPNVRSALVKEQTYQTLNEFRGFRHVVRSNYAYKLEPERVLALASKLPVASQTILTDGQQFCQELKSHGT